MKLDQPSSLDTHELPAVGQVNPPTVTVIEQITEQSEQWELYNDLDQPLYTAPPDIRPPHILEVTDLGVLTDRFNNAVRYTMNPTGRSIAFEWAKTPLGDVKALMERLNEHPALLPQRRSATTYQGTVVITDVSDPRPAFTLEQERAIKDFGVLSDELRNEYANARIAGRLSSWPTLQRSWDAALARSDDKAQALCAYGTRVLDLTAARIDKWLAKTPEASREKHVPPPQDNADEVNSPFTQDQLNSFRKMVTR